MGRSKERRTIRRSGDGARRLEDNIVCTTSVSTISLLNRTLRCVLTRIINGAYDAPAVVSNLRTVGPDSANRCARTNHRLRYNLLRAQRLLHYQNNTNHHKSTMRTTTRLKTYRPRKGKRCTEVITKIINKEYDKQREKCR